MSTRSKGSYIGPRPTGPSQVAASGIWDLRTVERKMRSSAWPQKDPYFSNVALLLKMDGTGNTFVDSSATPKTVTAEGNVTQTTVESKFGGSSAYFDGAGDTLRTPYLGLSNTDWTVEMWVYLAGAPSVTQILATTYNAPEQAGTFLLYRNPNNQILLGDAYGATVGSIQVTEGVWCHVAACYRHTESQLSLFIDGISEGSVTTSGITAEANSFHLGGSAGDNNIGNMWYTGYMDDVRVTVGVARYSSNANFTPPGAH